MLGFFENLALQANTHKTYRTHHRSFIQLCSDLDINPVKALTEDNLCAIITLYAENHKHTSIPGFVSALQSLSQQQGFGDLPRGIRYQKVKTGIDNFFAEGPTPKVALTLDDLCAFYPIIDHNTFSGSRNWAALCVAFFGTLRVGEYTGTHLLKKHVTIHEWGVSIHLTHSKTVLQPRQVDISARDDLLCPARALSNYLPFINTQSPDVPLFLSPAQNNTLMPMSDSEFITAIRALIKQAFPDRDASTYAGHSLRRGGATSMHLAGVPDSAIQRHGRWKSNAFRGYLDEHVSSDLRLMPTRAIKHTASLSHQ